MSTPSGPRVLPPQEIWHAIWRSFCDTWIPSVGIPLLLAVAAIPVDWWLRGHDQAAWEQVTGDDFRSAVIVLLAATLLMLVWHIFTAPLKHARDELKKERDNTTRLEAQLLQQRELLDKEKPRIETIEELKRLIRAGERVQSRIQTSTSSSGLRSALDEWLRSSSDSLDTAAQALPGRAEKFRMIPPDPAHVSFGPQEDKQKAEQSALLREINPRLDFLRNELTALHPN